MTTQCAYAESTRPLPRSDGPGWFARVRAALVRGSQLYADLATQNP